MYCDFYQLTERPFNVTPDPKFLYLNARYREALASLNYGITQRKGFITLIGEAGTGKTTLLKRLLEDLDPKTKTVFIFNTNVTFEEILEYILAEFDLPVHNGKKLYMLQRLNTFLLEELRGAGNVALLIDEAQDLEFSVLEDLRLLSNLETAKEKILQIVLSGQPELGQKLSNPVLRQLRQRIGINCRLLPLSRDEITEYIEYRLQAAQCPDLKLFTREAEDQVYHFSRGIPRLVNVVCDNALVIGYALGKKRITDDLIREAAADLLSLEARTDEVKESTPATVAAPQAWSSPKPQRRNARLGVIGAFVAALVIGLLSVGRTMLIRPSTTHTYFPDQPSSFEVIRPGSHPRGTGIDPPLDDEPVRSDRPDAAVESGLPSAAAAPPVVAAVPAREAQSRRAEEIGIRADDDEAPPAREPRYRPEAPLPQAESARQLPPAVPPVAANAHPAEARPEAIEHPAARLAAAPPAAKAPALEAAKPKAAAVPEPKVPGAAASAKEAQREMAEPPARPVRRFEEPRALEDAEAGDAPAPVIAVQPKKEKPEPPKMAAVRAPSTPEVRPLSPPAAEDSEPAASEASAATGNELDGVKFNSQVVRVGDSVSGIALRKYGQASYTVLDLLKLANPEVDDIDAISVGQTIRLPELGEGYPVLNEGQGKYSLLVVSSPQLKKAKELQGALRNRGLDARVTNTSVGEGKPLYRVVVSGSGGRDKAAATGKQIQKIFRENAALAELAE